MIGVVAFIAFIGLAVILGREVLGAASVGLTAAAAADPGAVAEGVAKVGCVWLVCVVGAIVGFAVLIILL
jgi:hypothetical protein